MIALPELPTHSWVHQHHIQSEWSNVYAYNELKMREYGEQCRKAAIEEAAKDCASICSGQETDFGDGYNQGAIDCEKRIKELIK